MTDDWTIVKTKKKLKKDTEPTSITIYKPQIKSQNKIKHLMNTNTNININIIDENKKKMLCSNILEFGKCQYGDKCLYAHSIDEQNLDKNRKKAYDILMDYIECTIEDIELYGTFLQLTKVCHDCVNGDCPGGYNCKNGVVDKKYQVCSNDLRYGSCYSKTCDKIHLTTKGFIHENHKKYNKNKHDIVETSALSFTDILFNLNKIQENNDIESSDDDTVDQIKEYLNNNSDTDDSCNESIFY